MSLEEWKKNIIDKGHNNLSVFGIGSEYKDFWQSFVITCVWSLATKHSKVRFTPNNKFRYGYP